MTQDDNDSCVDHSYLPLRLPHGDEHRHTSGREEGATIFSRIKSIWSQTAEFNNFDSQYDVTTRGQGSNTKFLTYTSDFHSSSDKNSNISFLDMSGATLPTVARSSCRFSDVKRIFTNLNFARSPTSKPINIRIHTHFESEQFLGFETSGRHDIASPSSGFTVLDTPPLTPDSINQIQTLLGSPDSTANQCTQDDVCPLRKHSRSNQLGIHTQDEDHTQHLSLSQQVKEGKKSQRPVYYGISPPESTELPSEEWYGIEYALQRPRRDMRGLLPFSQPSAGEHLKSHESWALLHQAVDPSVHEYEEFSDWKQWHSCLDEADRGIDSIKTDIGKSISDFLDQSNELAHIYVEERKTREWIRLEQEHGKNDERNLVCAKAHLHILVNHRADPFYPPIEHNIAWELKRSRTLGCFRDLSSPVEKFDNDETGTVFKSSMKLPHEEENLGLGCYDPTWRSPISDSENDESGFDILP